jgi:osmotically-inducible protein OsmY
MSRSSRTRSLRAVVPVLGLIAIGMSVSGCVALAVGAGATGAVAIAQERPLGQAANDLRAQGSIEEQLFASSERLFSQVNTKVIEGRVLLTGYVPSEAHRLQAGQIAWTTPRVREVLNEIRVGESPTVGRDARDTWISTQLRVRLTTDFGVREINYGYEIVGGTVYLLGIARTPEEHAAVTSHAARIPGVKQVVSHVILKTDQRRLIYDDDLGVAETAALNPTD